MKHKQKATWLFSGLLACVLLIQTAFPALASSLFQNIEVYTGVKVYVDDAPLDAGETHGNPDAFIYNGTTYVAVAAVSKSLGQNVIWDGANHKVYIGKHAGASYNLLDVCPPYQMSGFTLATQENATSILMSGQKYTNGMQTNYYWSNYDHPYALFNLNGQYSKLSFIRGHVDGKSMKDGRVLIYLDGKLAEEFEIKSEALPRETEIDLNHALSMKIVVEGHYGACAIADMQIS